MEKKITVIIPAFNEEKTICNVVEFAQKNSLVDEVIVVDNLSSDSTADNAKAAGAKLVTCNVQGKGAAMQEGVKAAKNECIVFLDGDIPNYNVDVLDKLSKPLLDEEADFVKASFERTTGGMVTELVTKPLLNIVFPDMYDFNEPLSGMVAAKKSMLDKLVFDKDYGVDIGILLDMIEMNARIKEVNIGKIENLSHHLKTMEKMKNMSSQVIAAILKRAKKKK